MSTVAPAPDEQRLALSGISWSKYENLLQVFEGRHIHLTYRCGEIEFRTVSMRHERAKKILARLIEALTEEWNVAIAGLGNTTYKREDLERGLEPDECWYIQHEEQMRNRDEIDLTIDPPPDLVVEVEVSRSVMDRMEIYARLGVPEVWRYDGENLTYCVLDEAGDYIEAATSRSFPQLESASLAGFLQRRGKMSETELVKSFRQWVRETLIDLSENAPE